MRFSLRPLVRNGVACHAPHTANLAPEPFTVHVVLDDFGNSGRVYRETAEEAADFNTVVDDLMAGQFNNPVRPCSTSLC